VGEPLAAPFAPSPAGRLDWLPANSVLSGTTNLTLQASASDANHPIQQVDLFLDGALAANIDHIPPTRSNLLNVTINGQAGELFGASKCRNQIGHHWIDRRNTVNNTTKVMAFAHGDRIELQSFDRSKPARRFPSQQQLDWVAGPRDYLDNRQPQHLARYRGSGIHNFGVQGNPDIGSFIQATSRKTNGVQLVFGVTNSTAGTTLTQWPSSCSALLNSSPDLTGSDGLTGRI